MNIYQTRRKNIKQYFLYKISSQRNLNIDFLKRVLNFFDFSEFFGFWLSVGSLAGVDPLVVDVDRLRQEVDRRLKI